MECSFVSSAFSGHTWIRLSKQSLLGRCRSHDKLKSDSPWERPDMVVCQVIFESLGVVPIRN